MWSITAGSLPAGLTLSSAGVLSGTPTAVGTTQVTIRATSSNGRSDQRSFPIQVVPSSSSTDWTTGGSTARAQPVLAGHGALDITAAPAFAFRWQTAQAAQPGYYAANVVINGERFYTVAGDGMLKAYSITGGTANRAPLWSTPVPESPTNRFRGFVTVAGTKLIVADVDERRLHAVRASDGDHLWKTEPMAAHVSFDPLIVGDTVVAVDNFGELKAYALSDGAERWEETATSRIGFGELSSDGTRIYGMAECVLYALDADTGAELWSTPTLTPEDDCVGTSTCNPRRSWSAVGSTRRSQGASWWRTPPPAHRCCSSSPTASTAQRASSSEGRGSSARRRTSSRSTSSPAGGCGRCLRRRRSTERSRSPRPATC